VDFLKVPIYIIFQHLEILISLKKYMYVYLVELDTCFITDIVVFKKKEKQKCQGVIIT